jgi:hypothetical protein
LAKKSVSDDFLVETLGTLANMAISKYNWSSIMEEHALVDFIAQHMVPGYSEDDIVLEVVILVGTIVQDEKSAKLITNSSIIKSLVELLLRKFDWFYIYKFRKAGG